MISFWLLISLATGVYAYFAFPGRETVHLNIVLLRQLSLWGIWSLFSVIIIEIEKRLPLTNRTKHIIYHFFFSVGLAAVHIGACHFSGIIKLMISSAMLRIYPNYVTTLVTIDVAAYWLVLGTVHLSKYYSLYRTRELQASELKAELVQAELMAMKMQLHPHFLFNTLNTIAALVRKQESPQALRAISLLGKLLRRLLDSDAADCVRLQEEVGFLEEYLEIERIRLARLEVSINLSPQTHDAVVPNLILQPLVENALRHGIGAKLSARCLAIRAWRSGDDLHLEVGDDGPGLPEGWRLAHHSGIGLSNVRNRLHHLYRGKHTFTLRPRPEGGTLAAITIPFESQYTPALSAADAN